MVQLTAISEVDRFPCPYTREDHRLWAGEEGTAMCIPRSGMRRCARVLLTVCISLIGSIRHAHAADSLRVQDEPVWVSIAAVESGSFDPQHQLLTVGLREMLIQELNEFPDYVSRETAATNLEIRAAATKELSLKLPPPLRLKKPDLLLRGTLFIAYDTVVLNLRLQTRRRAMPVASDSLTGKVTQLPSMVATSLARLLQSVATSVPDKRAKPDQGTSFPVADQLAFSQAVHNLGMKRYAEAAAFAANSLHEGGAPFPAAEITLGTALCLNRRFSDAPSHFASALASSPRLYAIRYRYAMSLAASGNAAEALKELGRVMQERPNGYLADEAAAWVVTLEKTSAKREPGQY